MTTTAASIDRAAATARARVHTRRTAATSARLTMRFQPTCRLGSAAYWFVKAAGWSTRYALLCWVIVSTSAGSARRGGATGTVAKTTSPTPPDTRIALRARAKTAGCRSASQVRLTAITGQCP
ncbi:hypothetical protein Voc01_104150 [Virgisporangium ochraceum]|uniref:Uncharacterized protein n=1 Tax=Virgisporangium ochraceum TaxID=65505 RepID=A0A8J4A5W7_9ACTN|nr:hypothetical protein [Virgisporangium ochraceum]GIJ75498.1 hypothetical protein Voc01_104150 [Virgisporangium ochraceum]